MHISPSRSCTSCFACARDIDDRLYTFFEQVWQKRTRSSEVFLVESWVEHLRQHERVTEADRIVQERMRAFHQANTPPVVTHLIAGLHRANKAGQRTHGDAAALEPVVPRNNTEKPT